MFGSRLACALNYTYMMVGNLKDISLCKESRILSSNKVKCFCETAQ